MRPPRLSRGVARCRAGSRHGRRRRLAGAGERGGACSSSRTDVRRALTRRPSPRHDDGARRSTRGPARGFRGYAARARLHGPSGGAARCRAGSRRGWRRRRTRRRAPTEAAARRGSSSSERARGGLPAAPHGAARVRGTRVSRARRPSGARVGRPTAPPDAARPSAFPHEVAWVRGTEERGGAGSFRRTGKTLIARRRSPTEVAPRCRSTSFAAPTPAFPHRRRAFRGAARWRRARGTDGRAGAGARGEREEFVFRRRARTDAARAALAGI